MPIPNNQPHSAAQEPSGIGPLLSIVQDELDEVRKAIVAHLTTGQDGVDAILQSAAACNGKMLRPALVLLCGKCRGGVTQEHIELAAVIEMIHLASLLHDDVIDKATVRRGRKTTNALHGNEAAVLSGDFLLSKVFAAGVRFAEPEVARVLSDTAVQLCQGELMQNAQRNNWLLSEAMYLEMIRGKTASLFGSCCYLGGVLGGGDTITNYGLLDYGTALGMAFQITDDLLDIVGDESRVGKTLGTDMASEKLTLPVIHLVQSVEESQRKQVAEKLSRTSGAQVGELLVRSGSLDYARQRAQDFRDEAVRALDILGESDARRALLDVADFVVNRSK